MKILCPQCFKQIENIKNNIAICDCGFEYNIKNKSSLYRIRLDGGYIKEGMTYKDIIKNIISANGGIAKLSALTSAGVPKEKIYKLCSDGFLQRVRQGY